jgi:mercuric ion transport protein
MERIKNFLDPVVTTGCSILIMTTQVENQTGRARPDAGRGTVLRTQKLFAAGGVLGALAASSCCILPLALFGLGVSGAWIGNLTRLAPYQPYFIAATVTCLGGGYWLLYRSRKMACAEGDVCARPLPNRIVKIGLILATVLVLGALLFDLIAPHFIS